MRLINGKSVALTTAVISNVPCPEIIRPVRRSRFIEARCSRHESHQVCLRVVSPVTIIIFSFSDAVIDVIPSGCHHLRCFLHVEMMSFHLGHQRIVDVNLKRLVNGVAEIQIEMVCSFLIRIPFAPCRTAHCPFGRTVTTILRSCISVCGMTVFYGKFISPSYTRIDRTIRPLVTGATTQKRHYYIIRTGTSCFIL